MSGGRGRPPAIQQAVLRLLRDSKDQKLPLLLIREKLTGNHQAAAIDRAVRTLAERGMVSSKSDFWQIRKFRTEKVLVGWEEGMVLTLNPEEKGYRDVRQYPVFEQRKVPRTGETRVKIISLTSTGAACIVEDEESKESTKGEMQ